MGLSSGHFSISAGQFKGRRFSMPPAVAGHRHVTPGILKEAAFQLMENHGEPGSFWDLCSGSGQMGLEALSRGYSPVHLVELDRTRFQDLKKRCRGYSVRLHNKDFVRVVPLIANDEGRTVVFLDLPYSFWNRDGSCAHIDQFVQALLDQEPARLPLVLIQAPARWSPRRNQALLEAQYSIESREYRGQLLIVLVPLDPR
jgi:16S rRNA G966 N2-methylase RsmD